MKFHETPTIDGHKAQGIVPIFNNAHLSLLRS